MPEDADVMAVVAVKDIDRAKKFYEGMLGLKLDRAVGDSVVIYKTNGARLQVYVSDSAGTNQATAVTWLVDDLKATAEALKAVGVTFEHYDFPGVKYDGDVHLMGEQRAAWFKDPDGNSLALVPKN
jgi:extradiol dioxygenase family protein